MCGGRLVGRPTSFQLFPPLPFMRGQIRYALVMLPISGNVSALLE